MTLTRSRSSTDSSPSVQARSVQDTSWLTVEQEHDFNDALSTFTHASQDKTEDEDTIEIHAPYFDAMIEDQDMMESVAHIDTEAVITRSSTPPPPPPSPPVPVISDTPTGSSFSVSGTHGDGHCGTKRTWIDRGHQANTQETDRSEIMTKRYRAYRGANDHYSRPYKRYPHNGRWTSNTRPGGDQPALNENRDNSGGFKEQVEDLRQLINAVSVGSNASYPHSINTAANSQTSDLGSVHITNTGDCGRRHSSPAAGMVPSRPHAFTSRRFSQPHHPLSSTVAGEQPLSMGNFNNGARGSGNLAFFTQREAPFGHSSCSCSKRVDYPTISPETLLQLALSELNCLITRHDEEKAAHGQTKDGLHFVESRLMDAYKRIQVLTEDYDHVLRRCRRAERSLLLTHSDYEDEDDNDDDDGYYYYGDDDNDKERSSQPGRRRYYNRDMSRGRSRGRSRSSSEGESRSRTKDRGRSKHRSRSTFSHRSRSTYSHKSHYKNRTKSTHRYRSTKY